MAVVSSTGLGAAFTPQEAASYIFDRLAAKSVGLLAGFTRIRTGRHQLAVPRITVDSAANWTAEAAVIAPTDPVGDSVVATPRKLAGLVQISNEVINDSEPDVLDALGTSVARALALKLDLAIFEGAGTAVEPRGLRNTAGIGTVSLGANGASPTNLDVVADAIGTLQAGNADATALVMHPRTWQSLSKIKTATGSAQPVLNSADPTGAITRSIYGVPVYLTSQLSIAETQGTSTDASSAFVVQADQVVVVLREDVTVEVDRSRLFNSDQAEVRAILRADVVVPNPSAVVRISGFRP